MIGAAPARQTMAGPARGGTIHIAYTGNLVTLDPAQAVTAPDENTVNGVLFNGLYQFDRNSVPQLDLAAGPPKVSADQKIWTFTLKKGVQFSNGTEVTADDLAFSITRVLDPHLKPAVSWGQSTDEIFQGAMDFVSGKARSVSGIQVLDPYTIRFTLTQPVAILPYILAESFNMVVPKALVSKEGDVAFANQPVGTGPFTLQSWAKGRQAVFARNPHYFHPGKPYVDKVIIDVNVAASVLALRIEKGELDGAGDPANLNGADVLQARTDPRYTRYLIPTPMVDVAWLDLNTKLAPFDQPLIRQAIAMSIDRRHLVQLLSGQAVPATQLYVPLMPQHDPALDRQPLYPFDRQKAQALVKASGYHNQAITMFYANDRAWQVAIAPGIAQDLGRIGLNVNLRGITLNAMLTQGGALKGHHIDLADWGFDFPDAYDIYSGEYTCAANAVGGLGSAHYCDATADQLATQAQGLPLGEKRNVLMRQAQRRILQAASRVPLIYLKNTEIVSPKIGGFYYHPIFAWQFENYWRTSP
jgi:peptide/nickel transport system substrate-binding protein/oligopeptide transport system substrate-binding protein